MKIYANVRTEDEKHAFCLPATKEKISVSEDKKACIFAKEHTFSEVTDEWFHSKQLQLKAATFLKYHILFKSHILTRFADISISDIDVSDINAFGAEKSTDGSLITDTDTNRRTPLPGTYVRTIDILINSVINFAIKTGYQNELRAPMSKSTENKKNIKVINSNNLEKPDNALNLEFSETSIGIMLTLHAARSKSA